MAEEVKGFANLMRYCNTLEDYNQKKADGKVTDDVLVIVLEDKVIKFKGYEFDLSGKGSGEGGSITIDDVLSATSTNPVTSKAIKEYVDLHPQYERINEIEAPEIDLGGTTVGGLKHSEERTLYNSYEGEELTEEQKAYNLETYNKILEGYPITINYMGIFLVMSGITPDMGIYLSTVVVIPSGMFPILFILNNDGSVMNYEEESAEISNQLYVPAPGATLSENAKENNKKVYNTHNVSYITVVAPSGGVYGIDAQPIGFDVGDVVFFFCYKEMYKATVDFTTGDVVTQVVGTLTAPTE